MNPQTAQQVREKLHGIAQKAYEVGCAEAVKENSTGEDCHEKVIQFVWEEIGKFTPEEMREAVFGFEMGVILQAMAMAQAVAATEQQTKTEQNQ